MESLQALFGEQSTAVTLVLIVLGLAAALVLLFWIFRKLASGNALRASRNKQPRLSVTDAAVVDDKRRLVLVRRDNVEHLVMIGGLTDFVIEQNIGMQRPVASPSPADVTVEAPVQESTASVPRPMAEERPAARQTSPAPRPVHAPEPVPARPTPSAPTAAAPVAGSGLAATTLPERPGTSWLRTDPGTERERPDVADAAPSETEPYADLEAHFSDLGEELVAAASDAEKPDHTSDIQSSSQSSEPIEPSVQPDGNPSDTGSRTQRTVQPDSEMEDEMQKLLNELAKA